MKCIGLALALYLGLVLKFDSLLSGDTMLAVCEGESLRSFGDMVRDYNEVEKDTRFLLETSESMSISDHERRCPKNGSCRCGVYSFPDVRSLKIKLLADSGSSVRKTTIEVNDRSTLVGLNNFAKGFHILSTANPKILASAFFSRSVGKCHGRIKRMANSFIRFHRKSTDEMQWSNEGADSPCNCA